METREPVKRVAEPVTEGAPIESVPITAIAGMAANDEKPLIEVGKYSLRPFHEGSVWLENDDGEGMQIWEQEFEEVLDDYWRKYF